MANHIEVQSIYPHEEEAIDAALKDKPDYMATFAKFGRALPDGYAFEDDAPSLDASPEDWVKFAGVVARRVSVKRLHSMPEIEEAVFKARMGKTQAEWQEDQLNSQFRQLRSLIDSGLLSEEDVSEMRAEFTKNLSSEPGPSTTSSTDPEHGDDSTTTTE